MKKQGENSTTTQKPIVNTAEVEDCSRSSRSLRGRRWPKPKVSAPQSGASCFLFLSRAESKLSHGSEIEKAGLASCSLLVLVAGGGFEPPTSGL